jgi:hypothetical protein
MSRIPLALVFFVACTERPLPPTSAPAPVEPPIAAAPKPPSDATVELPIPARAQAPESPPSGWCGETAIQEGLLYLGAWAPQAFINRAGNPAHPDLYSPEIPVALSALGVRTTIYPAKERGYDAFARWVRGALDEGDPVLAGVKIQPTAHPEWGLDHFVLVVGYGEKGLLVNTTWGHRTWVAGKTAKGLSFENAFYGIRLRGLALPATARPARLELLEESATTVKLRAICPPDHRPMRMRGNAVDALDESEVTIDAAKPSQFRCAPIP